MNSEKDFTGVPPQLRAIKRKETEESFYKELVGFVSRHFDDPRIANPDLKEHYMVRLNSLLQHNHFIKMFEANSFAQENLI